LLLEAAVLSYSLLREDIFESISLLLLDGTTRVEFKGIPPWFGPAVFAAGIDEELLFAPWYRDPPVIGAGAPLAGCLTVFR